MSNKSVDFWYFKKLKIFILDKVRQDLAICKQDLVHSFPVGTRDNAFTKILVNMIKTKSWLLDTGTFFVG